MEAPGFGLVEHSLGQQVTAKHVVSISSIPSKGRELVQNRYSKRRCVSSWQSLEDRQLHVHHVHRRESSPAFDSEDPDWLQRNANGDTCDSAWDGVTVTECCHAVLMRTSPPWPAGQMHQSYARLQPRPMGTSVRRRVVEAGGFS